MGEVCFIEGVVVESARIVDPAVCPGHFIPQAIVELPKLGLVCVGGREQSQPLWRLDISQTGPFGIRGEAKSTSRRSTTNPNRLHNSKSSASESSMRV